MNHMHFAFADRAFRAGNRDVSLQSILALDNAIEVAAKETNENDTLIVVTANHGSSSGNLLTLCIALMAWTEYTSRRAFGTF